MGEAMMLRVGARFALPVAAALVASAMSMPAFSADLPQVKTSEKNQVPQCATPGRLSAFLEGRNGKLDSRFNEIAVDYMRVGEELGIRWDIAFFQMLLETGNLTFTGDVSSKQNNFAGLGATGHHNSGESFPDVATGVKAHLQHLLMYAGEKIDGPVAERTRKVQEWGVLDDWHKSIKGPVTYEQLAHQWAPTSRAYVRDIETIVDAFYAGPCKSPDPKPELTAQAKPGKSGKAVTVAKASAAKPAAAPESDSNDEAPAAETQTAEAAPAAAAEAPASQPKVSGAELARRAVEEARSSGSFVRSSLGAGSLLGNVASTNKPADAAPAESPAPAVTAAPASAEAAKVQPAVTIINAPKAAAEDTAPAIVADSKPAAAAKAAGAKAETKVADVKSADTAKFSEGKARFQTAALGGISKPAAAPPPAAEPAVAKCRVWTASYGGAHAIIIKASADQTTNFTVLDVNEGAEKREAEAYISAYAKGGQLVGEFQSSNQALEKAFELCPEG
jgi:hypothetical protein